MVAGVALTLGLVGLMAAPTVLRSYSPQSVRAEEGDKADTPMEKHMEVLDKGMKKLRRLLRKKDAREEALEYVVKMEDAALAAKLLTPPMMEKISTDDQEGFLTGYRKEMASVTIDLLEMEIALIDRDMDRAKQLYEKLKKLKKDGHEKYTEDE